MPSISSSINVLIFTFVPELCSRESSPVNTGTNLGVIFSSDKSGTNLGVIFGSDKSGTNLGGLYSVFLVREGDGLEVQPTVKG